MKAKKQLAMNELANLGIQILQKNTTIEAVVERYHVPHWQMVEVLVSIVQNGYKSIAPSPQADLGRFLEQYNNAKIRKPVCFLHVMKTAGTTLTAYLNDFYSSEQICSVGSTRELEQLATETNLRKFGLIHGHIKLSWMLASGFDYEDVNYITFLRHPLSRQMSFYQHCMRAPESIFYDDFIQWRPNDQCLSLSPLKMRSGYATMADHLEATKDALERLFFVGVQESFDEGLYSLSCLLGQPRMQDSGDYNTVKLNTKSKSQKEVFPQKIIDEIMTNNWADIELHAYATDLFKRKFSREAMADFSGYNFPDMQQQSQVAFSMDQPMIGSGWYYREGERSLAHGMWRWTGPETTSTISFHVNTNTHYQFSIKVINTLSAEILDGLKVYVNDIPISYEKINPELGVVIIVGKIEKSAIPKKQKPNLVLSLEVPKVIKFNDVDKASGDERECGLAITNIDIIPDMSA